MLASQETARVVAGALRRHSVQKIVLDPVRLDGLPKDVHRAELFRSWSPRAERDYCRCKPFEV